MNYAIWKDGHVTAYKPGYARVMFMPDEIVSDWLQIVYPFTFGSKTCWPLKVNTQVKCMMAEDMVNGVILGATYNDEDTPPSGASENTFIQSFEDGTVLKYNKASHELSATIAGKAKIVATELEATISGKVKVTATDDIEATSSTNVKAKAIVKVSIEAPVIELKGNVTVLGVVAAGGISLAAVTGPSGMTSGKVNGNLIVDGNVEATNMTSTTEITVAGKPLSTHKHIGVQTGSGVSGIMQ